MTTPICVTSQEGERTVPEDPLLVTEARLVALLQVHRATLLSRGVVRIWHQYGVHKPGNVAARHAVVLAQSDLPVFIAVHCEETLRPHGRRSDVPPDLGSLTGPRAGGRYEGSGTCRVGCPVHASRYRRMCTIQGVPIALLGRVASYDVSTTGLADGTDRTMGGEGRRSVVTSPSVALATTVRVV